MIFRKRRISPSVLGPALAALVLGCSHADPFDTGVTDLDGPMQPGNPARLTLNPLRDQNATWLPDGSAILYTFEANAAHNFDRCLALLPRGGGTRRELCSTSAGHVDSTEVYGPSAVSDSGRLVYAFTQSVPGRQIPNHKELRVATLADPQTFEVLHPLPFGIDGFGIDSVLEVHWLGANRVVYLGTFGIPNTIMRDRIVVLIDLRSPAQPSVVPGTISVSSLAVGTDPDAIIITRPGDSRVYHLALASGQQTVLHDFAPGFPGDIDVRMNRLVTVTDSTLITVDLSTGMSDTLVGDPGTPKLRSPAVSINGTVVAEGLMDLWLFEAPSS